MWVATAMIDLLYTDYQRHKKIAKESGDAVAARDLGAIPCQDEPRVVIADQGKKREDK